MGYAKREHSKKDYLYAKAVQASLSFDERAGLSKKLYGFMKSTELFDGDLVVHSFWVAKRTLEKWHKGDIIFSKAEKNDYLAKGGKVRDILCHEKEVRTQLKQLSDLLNEPYKDIQHGFAKKRGVLTAVERQENAKREPSLFHQENKAEVLIDLSNAYEQISQSQLYAVLDIALDLNHEYAFKLANAMCYKGHLFQGNPVAPVLFNICTRRITKIIEKNLDDEIVITQYADDFSIVFKERSRVPKRLIKWITKLFKFSTFELNEEKLRQINTKRCQKSEWLGIARLRDKEGKAYVQASKRRKMLKKAKWFTKMLERGYFITTRHRTKNGGFVMVESMIKGLCSWLIGVNKLNKDPFINTSLASSIYQIKDRLSRVLSQKWYKEKFLELNA